MGIVGDVVDDIIGALSAAWDAVVNLFTDQPVGAPVGGCPLAPKAMSYADAQSYMDKFKKTDIPFDYPTDCCYARARKMCAEMEQDGHPCEKFWYGGNLGQADLHPHKPDGSTVYFPDPSSPTSWRYHVAPLVPVQQPDGSIQKMVLDPSLSDKPLTESEWKDLVGTSSDPREYTSDSKLGFPWQKDGSVAPPNPNNVMSESAADDVLQKHRDNRDAALHP